MFKRHVWVEAIIIGIQATKYTAAYFSGNRIKLRRPVLSHFARGEPDLYFPRYRVIRFVLRRRGRRNALATRPRAKREPGSTIGETSGKRARGVKKFRRDREAEERRADG